MISAAGTRDDERDFTLRDLLYPDFDKAASIWSQFEEGLLERMSVTEDAGKNRTAGTKFGIPGIAQASLGDPVAPILDCLAHVRLGLDRGRKRASFRPRPL